MIYLDNAATSFPKSENVYLEMDRVNRNLSVNSGRGSYKAAKEASEIITATKDKLLDLFNAKGLADVILTPSITHAINQVLYRLCCFFDISFMKKTEDNVCQLSPARIVPCPAHVQKSRRQCLRDDTLSGVSPCGDG